MNKTPQVSAYILTYNEENKIRDAIMSVQWADEVVVVDSDSTDSTVLIAEELGARVVNVPFEGFGKLRNSGISSCKYEWVFSLDADERCTTSAADEIRQIINSENPVDAYFVPRRNWFMGRWIKHSGWYPDYRQPQLFKKGVIHFWEDDEVHEGYDIEGTVGYISKPIWQFPFRNLEQRQFKANRYSSLGAEKLLRKGKKTSMTKAFGHSLASFLQAYIFKKGFMDGWAGFMIAFGSFEATFYKYCKLLEKQEDWEKSPGDIPF